MSRRSGDHTRFEASSPEHLDEKSALSGLGYRQQSTMGWLVAALIVAAVSLGALLAHYRH